MKSIIGIVIKILILIAIVAILMAVFVKRGPVFQHDERAPYAPTNGWYAA